MKRCSHKWKRLADIGHRGCDEVISWCPSCGAYKNEHHYYIGEKEGYKIETQYFERPRAVRDSEFQWYRCILDAFKKTAQDYAKHKCWDWGDKRKKGDCEICPPCRARLNLQLLNEE